MPDFPLPAALWERAEALAAGRLDPVPVRDAATVVLLRDGDVRPDGRIEVFLLRRPPTMAFAPGAYAFPGGQVEPDDDGGDDLPSWWADALCYGDRMLLRRVVGAAVRETKEESGVTVPPASLLPYAHWLTPDVEPRQYDTRFLLAALPPGQVARAADDEADEGRWISPREGLSLPMLPPTVAVLSRLARHADVAAALAERPDIERVHPVSRLVDGSWYLVRATDERSREDQGADERSREDRVTDERDE